MRTSSRVLLFLALSPALPAGTTRLASVSLLGGPGGGPGGGVCILSALSRDGRFVAFASGANNLVPADTNGAIDVFLHDHWTGTVERMSVDSAGREGNGPSGYYVTGAGLDVSSDGRRVVFASSNHVVGFHRAARALGIEEPVRPDSRYGVSKVFGEALGRLYADKHGLGVACLRIGSFRQRPQGRRQLATWVSPRDLTQLVWRCIDAPDYHFLVLYGISNNTRARWRSPDAALIGYAPQDNAEDYVKELDATSPRNESDPAELFHGGEFCALEFTGEVKAID